MPLCAPGIRIGARKGGTVERLIYFAEGDFEDANVFGLGRHVGAVDYTGNPLDLNELVVRQRSDELLRCRARRPGPPRNEFGTVASVQPHKPDYPLDTSPPHHLTP